MQHLKEREYYDRTGVRFIKPFFDSHSARESCYGVYIKNNKVLMVQSVLSEKWEFPGGGKEIKEDNMHCLKREFYEETGHKISSLRRKEPFYINEANFLSDDLVKYFKSKQFYYLIKSCEKKVDKPSDTENEIKNLQWLNLTNIHHYPLKPISVVILNKLGYCFV